MTPLYSSLFSPTIPFPNPADLLIRTKEQNRAAYKLLTDTQYLSLIVNEMRNRRSSLFYGGVKFGESGFLFLVWQQVPSVTVSWWWEAAFQVGQIARRQTLKQTQAGYCIQVERNANVNDANFWPCLTKKNSKSRSKNQVENSALWFNATETMNDKIGRINYAIRRQIAACWTSSCTIHSDFFFSQIFSMKPSYDLSSDFLASSFRLY